MSTIDVETMLVARTFTQVVLSLAIVATITFPLSRPNTYWIAALAFHMVGFILLRLSHGMTDLLLPALSNGTVAAGLMLQLLALRKFANSRVPTSVIVVPTVLSLAMALPFWGWATALVALLVHPVIYSWIGAAVLTMRSDLIRPGARILIGVAALIGAASSSGPVLALTAPDLKDLGDVIALLGTAMAFIMLNLGWVAAQKDSAEIRLQHQANRDQLTGLFNRRGLEASAQHLGRRAARSPASASVFVLDIDHFKSINDRWGHETGDAVLKDFGQLLLQTTRDQDICVRMGGEEFAIVFYDTQPAKAHAIAQRLRTRVHDEIGLPDGTQIRFSGGITPLSDEPDALDAALSRADAALYQAKRQGRDCVVLNVPEAANAA